MSLAQCLVFGLRDLVVPKMASTRRRRRSPSTESTISSVLSSHSSDCSCCRIVTAEQRAAGVAAAAVLDRFREIQEQSCTAGSGFLRAPPPDTPIERFETFPATVRGSVRAEIFTEETAVPAFPPVPPPPPPAPARRTAPKEACTAADAQAQRAKSYTVSTRRYIAPQAEAERSQLNSPEPPRSLADTEAKEVVHQVVTVDSVRPAARQTMRRQAPATPKATPIIAIPKAKPKAAVWPKLWHHPTMFSRLRRGPYQ